MFPHMAQLAVPCSTAVMCLCRPAVNRRMDEWTTLDHVDLSSVSTSEAELATAADPSNR